jgi:hypothetical protein
LIVDLFVEEDVKRYVRFLDLQAVPRVLLADEDSPPFGLLYFFLDLDLFVDIVVKEVKL